MGLAIFCFVMYIAFATAWYVNTWKASDKPEFNTFTWAAMLFCAGIGSDIFNTGCYSMGFLLSNRPNCAKSMSD